MNRQLVPTATIGLLLALALPVRAQTTSPAAQDSLALIALYRTTGGPSWTRNGNWLNGRLRTWAGVSTNEAGRVEVLDLADNNLAGPLPSELGALTALRRLSLQRNRLTGPIPRQVGNLASLETLTLFLNRLSGSIPAEIGRIAGLRSLGLGENRLDGAIPVSLGNLVKLEQLDVNGNPLVGPLPDALGRLASLRSLHSYNTNLSGPIPLTFVNLGALSDFRFTGTTLCEPPNAAFRAWLGRVGHVESTGVVCSANRPPVAVNDGVTTPANTVVTIDVLANDSDPDSDALSITNVGSPTRGTARVSGSAVRYTPAAGFVGDVTFPYTISDGNGATATANVSVTVTAVTADDAPPDALVFALDPPAPNPTRGLTSVRYGLAERAHVSLVVADLLGRRVAVLVDGEQEAGRHVHSLDASAGGQLPSGTYVVQLRAGARAASRTLVVLR